MAEKELQAQEAAAQLANELADARDELNNWRNECRRLQGLNRQEQDRVSVLSERVSQLSDRLQQGDRQAKGVVPEHVQRLAMAAMEQRAKAAEAQVAHLEAELAEERSRNNKGFWRR